MLDRCKILQWLISDLRAWAVLWGMIYIGIMNANGELALLSIITNIGLITILAAIYRDWANSYTPQVPTYGIIAGTFDVIHPGYAALFKECQSKCDHLIVALHRDPSMERGNKTTPVLSLADRQQILECLKPVYKVEVYSTEKELYNILARYALSAAKQDIHLIRFLGDDYKDKSITGQDLNIPIHYTSRTHGWSATKFKQLIYDSIN